MFHQAAWNSNPIDMRKILKLIFYYFLIGFFLILLAACGGGSRRSGPNCKASPDDPKCVGEKEAKEARRQAEQQEQAQFKSIGDCLKAKKEEAGVESNSPPTPEMLKQCTGGQ